MNYYPMVGEKGDHQVMIFPAPSGPSPHQSRCRSVWVAHPGLNTTRAGATWMTDMEITYK
jgi:hypothetical protein